MDQENPTSGDAGASISERLENYIAASEGSPANNESSETPSKEAQAQPDAAPEQESQQELDDDAQDTAEEPQVSLSDVAKYLGVEESALDVSDDGEILVKTKIDGKEGAAKFQELVKSYQIQGHADAKAREAAEMQRQVAERAQQFEQYARTQVEQIEQLAQIAHQELMGDASRIDWNSLAINDPAGYVQQKHAFDQRVNKVNAMLQQSRAHRSNFEAVQQQRMSQALAAEAQRLPSVIPEWADAKVAEVEKLEIIDWATKQGLSHADIANITRADVVALMRKAMLHDKGKVTTSVVEKKVRTAPKLVKPGQAQSASERSREGLRELKQQIRKSGGKGIAEYLLAAGKV